MILLLGGTGDARHLAHTLAPELPLIASLAGTTKAPKAYPCKTRVGGFGGADALADWLNANQIGGIIDATHPFAAQITRNAVAAAKATNTPIIGLDRKPWLPSAKDDWHPHPTLESAVSALPSGARAFFSTGRGGVNIIARRRDIWSALRVVDDPKTVFPGNGEYIVARPPFEVDAERALFRLLGITHVVAKNAGGVPARTKLDAAAALHLPVFLIERPVGPQPPLLLAKDIPAWARLQMKTTNAAKPPSDAAAGA